MLQEIAKAHTDVRLIIHNEHGRERGWEWDGIHSAVGSPLKRKRM
jgi:hypothetical protein